MLGEFASHRPTMLIVRWTDLWMLAGSAMRMAIPVQLNESPSESILIGSDGQSLTRMWQNGHATLYWLVRMSCYRQPGTHWSKPAAIGLGGQLIPLTDCVSREAD